MSIAALERSAWSVNRGQRVHIARQGLRRRNIEAVVLSGVLVPADVFAESHFELVIALPGASDRPITISSHEARSVKLTSQGVFQQRGRPPSMWLTMSARVDLADLRDLTGHGEISVFADLNLNPTPA